MSAGCDPMENGWERSNDVRAHRERIAELERQLTEVGAALEHIAEVCSVDDSFLGASPRQIEALSIANRVLARLRRSAPEGPDHE